MMVVKVLTRVTGDDGEHHLSFSAFSYGLRDVKFNVEGLLRCGGRLLDYKVGEVTQPVSGCGPLCAFDTVKHAKQFVGKLNQQFSLWVAEAEPSEDCVVFVNPNFGVCTFPLGTVLCDSIKLVRRIKF